MAKDFQLQAQWALVAIPAPIYFARIKSANLPLVTPLTNCSPPLRYAAIMLVKKSFGKLGNRATGRLVTGLEAVLQLPGRNIQCLLENISQKGCRLHMAEPLPVGTTAILKIDRIAAFGAVAWVRGQRFGIHFEEPVAPPALERIRWMAEHMQDHEKSKISTATAMWR